MPYKLTGIWPEVVTVHIGDGPQARAVGLISGKSIFVEKLSPLMETLKTKKRIEIQPATEAEALQVQANLARAAEHRDIIHLKQKVALGLVQKDVLMKRLAPVPAPQPTVAPESKTPRKPREDKTT